MKGRRKPELINPGSRITFGMTGAGSRIGLQGQGDIGGNEGAADPCGVGPAFPGASQPDGSVEEAIA